jgi:alpha-L-arabinofuranosidase
MNQLLEKYAKDKIDYLVFHCYQPWAIGKVLKDDSLYTEPEELDILDTWKAWTATPNIDSISGFSILPLETPISNALSTGFDIALTEWNWNGWYVDKYRKAGLSQPDLAKGIGAAGFLHAIMREGDRIKIACQSMLAGKNWGITGIRIDPEYEQGSVVLPTAQVTGLYSKFHGNQLLETRYENIPKYKQPFRMNSIKNYPEVAYLDILSTRSDTKLFIHVINRSFSEDYDLEISIEEFEVKKDYKQFVLIGDKTDRVRNSKLEQIADIHMRTFSKADNFIKSNVPSGSVSVFIFELGSG